ncbi:hypothetical protein SYNPS1DRAFT_29962 [Syncephalis pseudoplumigaleata]|uniref:Altered inheritance of mitochondria protein 24, mitochondrial n=1 Tax=Syncephalis pseudoplumigaleata TaxID=1712513 RepID=A0A4P9YY56_9FUNG|nr:hypothetical protein SYNPS1DRAFT_29962 [Syncephalis pseudoplumigaleata]|eukprot:RKP24271.1 hypothetical protein SYNPS1DRAFT_29962 [Syncephalis pseudoplumigaleata]
MPHIPELVVERIATYADTKSLVVLASCNRQWNRYISQLRTWKQRYTQEHPLEDDDELSWLRWYIKTLRASATDTSSDDGDIDWFRAYCHRHACDANWFKNDPKRVKDVKEVTAGSRNRDIVLDRMYRDFSLKEKYVFEYCQPRRAASQQSRYWRRHILRSPDSDSNGYLIECVLTSTFMRIDGQINRRISGRGQVVLNAYGGIYRLGLAPGEIYYIEPRRVVAWDLSLASIEPTLHRKDETRPAWLTSRHRIVDKGLAYLFRAYHFACRLIGNEKLVRIEGPGDIYLASRVEPRFPSLRSWYKQNDPYQELMKEQKAVTSASADTAKEPVVSTSTAAPSTKTKQ